jgi:hypothetical protein
MRLETAGSSASLESIVVACSCGVAPKTMRGAFAKSAVGKCTGKRPWLGRDSELCDEMARTLQRGASNVWFSDVVSSLSIPPWSEAVFGTVESYWPVLKNLNSRETLREALLGLLEVKRSGFSVDDIVDVIMQRRTSEERDSAGDLKKEEYAALRHGFAQRNSGDQFVCKPADRPTPLVADNFDRVMVVSRLREVRALRSFTRLAPYAPGALYKERAPLANSAPDWLPAIEIVGEGVFFNFGIKKLSPWESRPEVVKRTGIIAKHYADVLHQLDVKSELAITPRLVLLHTFAHAVINQWALDCGYPAASLRERLYADEDMAGVLIYTATGDSAGSLGGVIGQAKPNRLEPTLKEALARSEWCSGDPLCIEADAQGTNSLNLAACHACVLLPEVSCETNNVFLDRGMLVGWPEHPRSGFFSGSEDF